MQSVNFISIDYSHNVSQDEAEYLPLSQINSKVSYRYINVSLVSESGLLAMIYRYLFIISNFWC